MSKENKKDTRGRISINDTALFAKFKEASKNSPFGTHQASAEEAIRLFNKKHGDKKCLK